MKIQYSVENLEKGMYVDELDRPWEGTPFLFQGFLIDSDADLVLLRQHCKHVFVDDLQSKADQALQDKLHAAVRGSTITTVVFQEWSGVDRLRETIKRGERVSAEARGRLTQFAAVTSIENTEDMQQTRAAIGSLIEDITADPKTSQWMRILSDQDASIGQHSVNTATLAVAFAADLGWDKQLQAIVGEGAMLHDVGMARVPPQVRQKPGKLDAAEYRLVKLHPGYGGKRLEGSDKFDPRILEIVRHHHERLDGSGYPDGLKGGGISPWVQVVSICDVYDSYTTLKPYRRQVTPSAAMRRLTQRSIRHFDKNLVEKFIRSIGIYPLGSLVRLQNGAVGIIVASDEKRRLHPTVLLVRTPDGESELPRRVLNLASLDPGPVAQEHRIKEILDPEAEQVDVRGILRQELQLLH
ncbi:MAG: HD-GYP domain-containing protein [Gammaproteobacteria bacterium]